MPENSLYIAPDGFPDEDIEHYFDGPDSAERVAVVLHDWYEQMQNGTTCQQHRLRVTDNALRNNGGFPVGFLDVLRCVDVAIHEGREKNAEVTPGVTKQYLAYEGFIYNIHSVDVEIVAKGPGARVRIVRSDIGKPLVTNLKIIRDPQNHRWEVLRETLEDTINALLG